MEGLNIRLHAKLKGRNHNRNKAVEKKAAKKPEAKTVAKEARKKVAKERRIYISVPVNEIPLAVELGAKPDDLAYSHSLCCRGTCYIPEDVVRNSCRFRAFWNAQNEQRWSEWDAVGYDVKDSPIAAMWAMLEKEYEENQSAPNTYAFNYA